LRSGAVGGEKQVWRCRACGGVRGREWQKVR